MKVLHFCIVFLCVGILLSTEPCSQFLKSNSYKIYFSKFLFRYSCFCTTVTDCNRVPTETLEVSQHSKKFPNFYGPQFLLLYSQDPSSRLAK